MRIAVVGAGFAGLIFAYKLAAAGYSVDVYEEHYRVGYPPHCTGLVSEEAAGLIGVPAAENTLAAYRGVALDVEGVQCTIETRDRIVKLDRVRLEESLAEAAAAEGARLHFKSRVSAIDAEGRLTVNGEVKGFDLAVLAEGLHGRLRQMLGLNHAVLTTFGLNAETPIGGGGEHVWIRFEVGLPGFAWRLSYPGGTLLGALSTKPRLVKAYLEGAIKSGVASLYGGIVVHGPPLEKPRVGRVLLVGDAAGLNKPLTGGGLYPNALLAEAVSRLDLAGGTLEELDEAASSLTSKLAGQYRLARGYYGDPARGVRVLKAAVEGGLCRALTGRIEYDRHEALVTLLLSRPAQAVRILYSTLREAGWELYGYLLDYIGIKSDR